MMNALRFALVRGDMRAMVAVILLALTIRIAYLIVARPDPLAGVDSIEYDQIARGLVEGRGYTDPIGLLRPPIYPFVVAACYAIGGFGVLIALQVALGSASAALVGRLAQLLFNRPQSPTLMLGAGALAAVYPWPIPLVGAVASETIFTFLALAALIAIQLAAGTNKVAWSLLAGLVFGLAALTRANILVLAPPLALWLWWRGRGFSRPAALAAGLILALAPFTVWNAAIGNGFVVASSGGGMSFFTGNNPDMARLYSDDISDDEWRSLNQEVFGARSLALLGCDQRAGCETRVPRAQREAHFYAASFRWIGQETGTWAQLEIRKFAHAVRPWVDPRAYSQNVVVTSGVSFVLVLILAALGLKLMPRPQAVFISIIVATATLASVVWFVVLRYRFALVDPVLLAATAGPLAALWERVRRTMVLARSASGPAAAASSRGSIRAKR